MICSAKAVYIANAVKRARTRALMPYAVPAVSGRGDRRRNDRGPRDRRDRNNRPQRKEGGN